MHLLCTYYAWWRSYTLATCYMRRRVPGRITPPTAMEGLRQPAVTWGDHTNQQPTSIHQQAGIHHKAGTVIHRMQNIDMTLIQTILDDLLCDVQR